MLKIEKNEDLKNFIVEEFMIVTNAKFDVERLINNGIYLNKEAGEHSILEKKYFPERFKLKLNSQKVT
jgi:hypothetical protein